MWYLNMTWRNAAGQSSGGAPPPAPCASNATAMDEKQMMQGAVVFTAVLMAILGGTLCVMGLERLIRGRFTLFSMVRFLLRFTFILFLPLLSYMRANAKEGEILFVLLWMLLIELFRKKVEAMVPPSANGSFSRSVSRFRLMGHSDEVTRLVWIGYLIYSNVDWECEKIKLLMMPMFAILWSLAVAKLGQRVLNEWKAQDSLSAAGSANLIAGYMQHVLEQEEEEGRRRSDGGSSGSGAAAGASPDPDLDAVMGNCQYVVMGEEKLVLNKKERRRRQTTGSKVLITTPHCGYGVGRFPHDQDELKHVHLLVDLDKVKNLVTVKDIWQNLGSWLALFGNRRPKFIDHMCLMCLSFSLFKLLRRRFEHYPMVEVGSKMARRLMVEGLLNDHEPAAADNASRAFRVIQLELDFLDNYYQAGVPVVMSAPWLFFINFLSSLLFVSIYVLAVAILLLIPRDDTESLTKYFVITMLLVMTLLAVEITDLTTYLFSNWFLVHLLCLYVAPGGCLWNFLVKPIICCFIAYRLFVFNSLKLVLKLTGRPVNEKKMKTRQVSILQVCEPVHKMFAWASQVTLPTEAKVAIVRGLKKSINNPDTGGDVSLPHDISGFSIRGKTTTEIILACHLATELLEVKHGKPKKKKKPKQKEQKPEDWDHQTMATTLSRYCMYLVARVPELLPDDERWVSDRYEDVKSCLKEASRRCCCSTWWCCPWRRAGRWKAVAEMKVQLKEATAQAGVELYQQLEKGKGKEDSTADDAWKALAQFWVKLLIYLAPSNDVEGHAKALASSGSDLITCLWALCTHAGIKRHPSEPAPAELHAGTHQV
ncbi:hypothetical protein SETIT_3G354000v2 [Setaria italica]|uniref:DUF4220 domain-containing protein n=2 Tax=Setaria italica TaxID=4555 RepID=A0A368QMM6_SETIT|nr:hypothetical protein SETIT_3G354000v2 [Setaria italica]